MDVKVNQLMDLPELMDLKLVSGDNGINKAVKWFHFIETPDDVSYIQSDELILLTGIGILDNQECFVELIKGAINRNAAGVLVNTGKYFNHVPEYIKELSNQNDFPVFEVPWEVNLSEVTKSICNFIVKNNPKTLAYQDLLRDLVLNDKANYEDFMESISLWGHASLNSYRMINVKIENLQNYLYSKNIRDEKGILKVKDKFFTSVNNLIWNVYSLPMSFLRNESANILIINEKETSTDVKSLAESICKTIKQEFPEMNINVGISNLHTQFSKIKKSYIEAEKAVKSLTAENYLNEIAFYSNIKVYKLIDEVQNIEQLKEYYDDTVGKLVKYDEQNNTDYLNILYVFLQADGNSIRAAQKLYLHRNTLMYKINKIQEIIKSDLSDINVRFEYYLGYIIKNANNF